MGYGSSSVSRRRRRTQAQLGELDAAIMRAVDAEHPVSLRGVFYRVVSAGTVEKTELGYRAVSRELVKLRRAGIVPYGHVVDGTRTVFRLRTWDNLDEMLEDAAASYRRSLWHDQPCEVVILSEKDAITGVLSPVTDRWDVPLGIVRGYASETFAWEVAEAVRAAARRGKDMFVYQLGDHDPSGVDAWRAFMKRVLLMLGADERGAGPDDAERYSWEVGGRGRTVVFERLAVTPWQVRDMGLPTRPTKQSDSRARKFAGGSVEVDAIPAPTLRTIVEDAITRHIDRAALEATRAAERAEREILSGWAGLDGDDGSTPG